MMFSKYVKYLDKDILYTYIFSSAANDSKGDKVPLVRMTFRMPCLRRSFIVSPGLKHQQLKVRSKY